MGTVQVLTLSSLTGGVREQLGLELRRLKEARGLAVEELAQKSGISATTIRAVERGAWEARGHRCQACEAAGTYVRRGVETPEETGVA